jgi:glycolate oxidase iron-sulfur subunit
VRAQIERNVPRGMGQRLFRRLIFATFPRPERLRVLALPLLAYQKSGVRWLMRTSGMTRLLPRQLRAMEALLPDVPDRFFERLPFSIQPKKTARRRVGMLSGCVQQVFFSHVNAATARVLAAEGVEVRIPPHQGCCGALSVHTGRGHEAARFRSRLARRFTDVDTVVVNVAGCGSALKEHGFPARDVTEVLADLPPRAVRHPLPLRVAYHDACHLSHGQGVRVQPRSLLASVPDLDVVELPEPEICCGSAGVYNLLQPEPARALGARKARAVRAAGVDAVVTGNPGCVLQLRAALRRLGAPVPIVHTVEVLDASIRGIPIPSA